MRKKKRIKPRNPLVEIVKKIKLKIIRDKTKYYRPTDKNFGYDP